MGLGGHIFCEWNSVTKTNPRFRDTIKSMEKKAIKFCQEKWFPGRNPAEVCGYLTPRSGDQFGRTSILPELFDDNAGNQMSHWRQHFTSAGHQTLITGTRAGNTIPEDFIIEWIGLAFPNKQQHITEIKFQIGDRKYGRLNLEELHAYNIPAVVFEEGLIINEEETFELYGYVEGPIPDEEPFVNGIYQRIVMLGAAYYRVKDKVLGNCGAAI